MLSLLISIPISAFGVWLLARTVGLFRRFKASRGWWIVLIAIQFAGGYVGFRLAYLDLKISPTFRWVGAPMPIGFFALEGERWTDFVPPLLVQLPNLLADIFTPIVILSILLLLAWRWRGRRGLCGPAANRRME